VVEGSFVNAGDLLIRIDDTRIRANYDLYRTQYLIALGEKARLEAERDGLAAIVFSKDLLEDGQTAEVQGIIRSQTNIFGQRKEFIRGQEQIKREQEGQYLSEIDALEAQKTAEAKKLALIKEELAGVKELYDKGLEKKPRLLALQRASAEIEGHIGQHAGRIARARQSINELQAQMIDIKNKMMTEVVTQLRDAEAKTSDLTQRLRTAEDALKRVDIRAPRAGYVVNLVYVTIGGVIEPGKPVLEIVPTDDLLLVETRFDPSDIDVLRPGLPAEVTLLAFNRRDVSTISGKLIMVSADALVDKAALTATPYYAGRVELDREQLESMPNVRLVPGMPAQVMVKTGERTPLSYLVDPIRRSMNRALRESN
jgi:HlyD family type I secretion membrane fusion protein